MAAPPVAIRPLVRADATVARALLTTAFGNTLYAEAPRAALARALAGEAPAEAAGLVAVADGGVVGVVIHGAIAGTLGSARIHAVAIAPGARRRGLGRALIQASVAALGRSGARLVLVECAEADALAAGRALLHHCRFIEESRIPDYVRDGIGLSFLRLDLPSAPGGTRS